MRVILSRKGFDTASGGCASPVLNGVPVTLPIPVLDRSVVRYGDLMDPLGALVNDVSRGRWTEASLCHLDPDLRSQTLHRTRPPGWRGTLGQVGAAQGHLSNQGVCEGDLFLFFGLFRVAKQDASKQWCFHGPARHLIFGWLQVDEVLALGSDGREVLRTHPWLEQHPHACAGYAKNNTIYVARERLDLVGLDGAVPGCGWFTNAIPLTAPDATRVSDWRVPDWLDITQGGVGMTYHPAPRWEGRGRLRAVGRGQEFVANITGRKDATEWLSGLFQ